MSEMGLSLPDLNEIEIASIDQQPGGLSDDKNRVETVDGVGQQGGAAGDTEIPESDGDDAFPAFFAGNPLDKKAHGEHSLA